jgi:tRNA threonylcarbamoyl adenosine modification protein YeaZ
MTNVENLSTQNSYTLAIDTSFMECSACLIKNGVEIFYELETRHQMQSDRIPKMVENVLKNENIFMNNISTFSCSKGVGTFTGIRIALAFLEGVKIANEDKNFIYPNGIEAVYFDYIKNKNLDNIELSSYDIFVILDAIRDCYYIKKYDKLSNKNTINFADKNNIICICKDEIIKYLEENSKNYKIIGSIKNNDEISKFLKGKQIFESTPNARNIGFCAEYILKNNLQNKENTDFLPLYVRDHGAKKSTKFTIRKIDVNMNDDIINDI